METAVCTRTHQHRAHPHISTDVHCQFCVPAHIYICASHTLRILWEPQNWYTNIYWSQFIEFLQANVAGGQTEYKLTVCRQPVGEGASLDLDGWFWCSGVCKNGDTLLLTAHGFTEFTSLSQLLMSLLVVSLGGAPWSMCYFEHTFDTSN